jgi:hypothetical protein
VPGNGDSRGADQPGQRSSRAIGQAEQTANDKRHVSRLMNQIRLVRCDHVTVSQREFNRGNDISCASPLAQQVAITASALPVAWRKDDKRKQARG